LIVGLREPNGAPEAQQIPSRAVYGWQSLVSILKKIASKPPKEAILSLLDSNYADYLLSQYPNADERVDDLKVLADFASRYDKLTEFLSEMSLQESFSKERMTDCRDDEEKIILSTIHQAKGLEWNSVFVMGLVEKQFPHYRAVDELGGVEEERRLFYVAATRAKRNLYFTYSLTQGFGDEYLVQPSRFIKEIPSRLLEKLTVDDPDDLREIEID
jgi:DNA helicase-2/ATP-dependent DNA helicase PcrA